MGYQYKVGTQNIELSPYDDLVAVRFKEPAKYSIRATITNKCGLGFFRERTEVPDEKYTIIPVGQDAKPRRERHQSAVESLQREADVARVATVFKLGETIVLATDRVLIGFNSDTKNVLEVLDKYYGEVVGKTGDEYVVQLQEGADPLDISTELAKEENVIYAEPDFVSIKNHVALSPQSTPQPSAGDPQAHRQYAINITKAVDAWQLQKGDPQVRIAILDEGVDMAHEDLSTAIVGSYDGVDDDTFQEPNPWDGHGTACAGLAAAVHDNDRGIKGIGGGCSIQAVRIAYSPQDGANWVTRNSWIARAIDWAWREGASVISNSWGGGAASTAIINAFERARTQGRNGKGSVIVVAAGNDSGPVDFPGNLPNVLTVSASNEYDEFKTKTSRDGEYWWGSNFGPEVDLAAPGVHNLTTDISGSDGYTSGNYTDFNGTSSATPIVAGAVGLLLSANNDLTESEARDYLRQAADKVGTTPYQNGRNDQFGNGRLNVLAALQNSQPLESSYVTIHKVLQDVPIKDQLTSRTSVAVGDSKLLRDIKVHIDIQHTYIGDLQIKLVPPVRSSEAAVTLHNRTGQGQDNLVKTYDVNSTPDLERFVGKNIQGTWMLEVNDDTNQDEGNIVSLSLEITY
ncbi:MAG: S8 family serine peptidase [Candidatus Scalindua sp.]|jgi:subtilisin family serine protease|nr:S8 family serine peptidase [Candidatus Scalindua sp.]MBT5305475.1 S8 family serine peptidase [Candidatus Scalindua sp.]MBT6226483.1 S8 family serine peptidase [Candidatus Scalindua sp.]MBT6563545.1 S8 family serine peptidase [Candidatus Scalindua sp.]MBT7210099.1 S8 family serine peptidase [Candidatus Scalindua sp.]